MTDHQLMDMAKAAAEFAYAPYSGFYVGAALLAIDGTVYTGCNIENASYSATNCAERTAVFKAISDGKKEFCKIAVTASDGSTTYPCGICLQVLQEFMPEGSIILKKDGRLVSYTLKDLLPYGFTL